MGIKILHTLMILSLLFFIGYILLESGYITKYLPQKIEMNQSCDIPADYCDYSIRSLESELKESFKAADKCFAIVGREKREVGEMLNACNQRRVEIRQALIDCTNNAKIIMSKVYNCSQVLNNCNEELRECITK